MNGSPAYYSVVQYVPDPGRLEAANIGVVVLCPEAHFLAVKLAPGNDRIARFFGRNSFNSVRLNASKRALEDRIKLEHNSLLAVQEFERFILTRANEIRLSPLRPMTVFDPKSELDELFEELAGQREQPEFKPRTHLGRKLKKIFESPELESRIRKGVQVTVPITGTVLRAPYAWVNGHINLIKPLYLNSRALSEAMDLALENDLLHKHGKEMKQEARLVVAVGAAGSSDTELADVATRLLREYEVQVYEEAELELLRQKVDREAHH